MRALVAALVGLALALVVSIPALDSPEPPPNLFGEYLRSGDVVNDPFAVEGLSGEDRMANFAAHFTPQQLLGALFSAYPCESGDDCRSHARLVGAIHDAVGADAELYHRSVLVKRGDGTLEVLTFYVGHGADGSRVLADTRGRTYSGLDDFRTDNDLLGPDDFIYTPEDLTAVEGEGRLVTVSGRTPPSWPIWLLTGAGALVLVTVVRWLVVRRVDRRVAEAFPQPEL